MRSGRVRLVVLELAGYAALLAGLSLLPGQGRLSGWDTAITATLQNGLHVPAYGVLLVCAWRALGAGSGGRRLLLLGVAGGCVAFGTALEAAQAMVPGRVASLWDILLNVAGVAMGVGGVLVWRWRERRAQS